MPMDALTVSSLSITSTSNPISLIKTHQNCSPLPQNSPRQKLFFHPYGLKQQLHTKTNTALRTLWKDQQVHLYLMAERGHKWAVWLKIVHIFIGNISNSSSISGHNSTVFIVGRITLPEVKYTAAILCTALIKENKMHSLTGLIHPRWNLINYSFICSSLSLQREAD